MASPDNSFRSSRLIYRAVESPDDDVFFQSIQTDTAGFENSNTRLIRPQSRKDAANYQKQVAEESLLGVVICIAPASAQDKATPVGSLHLNPPPPSMSQHRFAELGIDILPAYQGQGYGSEAIKWALEWAFNFAGVHRVQLRAFEWNHGARKLYTRLGFKHEGTSREQLFYKGRFWDDYQYGMLEKEWRELYGNE
jgi:RimJ/RimL family protein N-acetyltransferase